MGKPRQAHPDSPAVKRFIENVKTGDKILEKELDELLQKISDAFKTAIEDLGEN